MAHDSIILERRFVPDGTLVMRQDDMGNCAYLVQSGSVSVYTRHDGLKVELARLGPGEIFGEMALIFNDPRTASVRAVEDCNLIVINRKVLRKKLDETDPTIKAIVTMLTQRIITANNAVIKNKTDIDDLIDTTRIIYQNILFGLDPEQKKYFQDDLLPKLDGFLSSIKSFHERFDDER